jgi:hypothetical protein
VKHLREEVQIKKWSIIAKKMAEEFEMPGRTGKQCRERYVRGHAGTITTSAPAF